MSFWESSCCLHFASSCTLQRPQHHGEERSVLTLSLRQANCALGWRSEDSRARVVKDPSHSHNEVRAF